MKKEADFSILLRHYLKAHPLPVSCPLEVKDTRGAKSFPFSEWPQEQRDNAMSSKKNDKGNLIRISVGTTGAPDYAWYIHSPAYISIKYPIGFVIIDAETLILEISRSKRKSLTWERAKEISIRTVSLRSQSILGKRKNAS